MRSAEHKLCISHRGGVAPLVVSGATLGEMYVPHFLLSPGSPKVCINLAELPGRKATFFSMKYN